MAHADLTAASTVSLAGLGSPRTYAVVGGDATTRCTFYIADSASQSSGVPLQDGRNTKRNTLVLSANQQATFTDASGFVAYTLTGTAPTAVMVDGPGAGTSAAVGTTGAAGTVLLTTAPGSASAPTVVSSTDPRVATITEQVVLTAADGSLAESGIMCPGVAGTITAVYIEVAAAITQSDTSYLTFTLSVRNGAGGGASVVASATTKVTGGVAFLAFQFVSLGAITNAAIVAASVLTLTSAKTSAGQAVALPIMVRVAFTPTV